jgi:hypothetical protein
LSVLSLIFVRLAAEVCFLRRNQYNNVRDKNYLVLIGDLPVCFRLWAQELERSSARNEKPSLFRVLRRCFGLRVILFGLVLAVEELLFK